MRKVLAAVTVSIVISGVFLACSSGSETPPEPAQPPPPPEPTPPPPEPTPPPPEPVPPPVPETPCGEEGQPRCPLQGWMEDNVTPAVEARDAARLGELLEQIATLAPDPSWNEGETGWATIANTHAAKAKGGDFRGARAACKQCHKQWRERYRTEHRHRPVPGAPAE